LQIVSGRESQCRLFECAPSSPPPQNLTRPTIPTKLKSPTQSPDALGYQLTMPDPADAAPPGPQPPPSTVIDPLPVIASSSDGPPRQTSAEHAPVHPVQSFGDYELLDEIGRGTATYDGLAIAWAVVEFIHSTSRAKTLFATHYHELTELEHLDGVKNFHVSVKENAGGIVFLRKVESGAADRSYGIEVARLAGLPASVIERAREVLRFHETEEDRTVDALTPRAEEKVAVQVRLFEVSTDELRQRIRGLKIDDMRPVEALRLLEEMQRELT